MDDRTAPDERWLPVPGFEDCYEVSDLGRVRSVDRVVRDRLGRLSPRAGGVLSTYPNPNGGHLTVRLSRAGAKRTAYVHKVVLSAFVGPCPEGLEGCHEDGDSTNNCLTNLRYDTRSGNRYDAVRHGTDRNSRKVSCPRGHRLEAPNLVPGQAARGRRVCRSCGRANSRTIKARRARRAVPDFQALSDQIYAELLANT